MSDILWFGKNIVFDKNYALLYDYYKNFHTSDYSNHLNKLVDYSFSKDKEASAKK